MSSRPMWLDEYASIIDKVRNELTNLKVVEEETLKYAVIRLFARVILSMCEIYTLMSNGYPEGALALSRQIYESMVILDYLIKHSDDNALIKRFYDDVRITFLNNCIERGKITDDSSLHGLINELDTYKKTYAEFCDKRGNLNEYWWVSKGCKFSALAAQTDYPKNYMYKETSSVVHMSLKSSLVYIGNNQEGILIGQTYDGVEEAGWYSMLCFCVAMDLFQKIVSIEFDELIAKSQKLIETIDCYKKTKITCQSHKA